MGFQVAAAAACVLADMDVVWARGARTRASFCAPVWACRWWVGNIGDQEQGARAALEISTLVCAVWNCGLAAGPPAVAGQLAPVGVWSISVLQECWWGWCWGVDGGKVGGIGGVRAVGGCRWAWRGKVRGWGEGWPWEGGELWAGAGFGRDGLCVGGGGVGWRWASGFGGTVGRKMG